LVARGTGEGVGRAGRKVEAVASMGDEAGREGRWELAGLVRRVKEEKWEVGYRLAGLQLVVASFSQL
jgi:hypothetical protein